MGGTMAQRTEVARRQADPARRRSLVIVAAATGVFVVVFSALGLIQYWRFHVPAFDLGIFTQGTWLLSRFDAPFFVTIRGLPLFADHSSYILVFLAPLAWVFPTAQMLIVVNVLALAATAPISYAVARRADTHAQ